MNELEQQILALQAMLFFVLQEVGEPVVVSKEIMEKPIPDDLTIDVDLDETGTAMVFQIVRND